MRVFFAIAIGGALGSLLRYLVSGFVQNHFATLFPFGTLSVNVVGSFFIGLFVELLDNRFLLASEVKLFLVIGLLGSFTTFSTFSFETMELIKDGSSRLALLNIVLSSFLGLVAVLLGNITGRIL